MSPPSTLRPGEDVLLLRRAEADAAPTTRETVRGDIQGLRAVAVLVVLVFHFWPGSLTGGYVGVDVFFVISGFLISSHLLRSPPTTPGLLARFWGRRIRRLLPAASLVLAVTLLASVVWMPSTLLPTVAREVVASALSVENWVLAGTATDYLAAENAPSPVQHYWSLSVEEQFYVLWPLLIAALAFASRGRRRAAWWGVGLVCVTAGSLAASVLLTESDAAAAYFVTQTRVWELGLGSLLALAVHLGWRLRTPALQAALSWAGLALIGYAVVTFDGSTAFPGIAALVPTLGAVLVLAADADGIRWSPGRLLGARPSQQLGDVSYSVYLWHWPVVVLVPYALTREMTNVEKLVAVGAVILVSVLTKRFVEDPVRRSRRLSASLPRTFAILAASVVVLGAAGVGIVRQADAATAAEQQALAKELSTSDCVGAEATRNPACPSVTGDQLLSTPSVARIDLPVVYADGCWSSRPFTKRQVCTYGDPAADVRIALMGNSHAGHWQPALAPVVEERGWRLDTYLISQCYSVTIPVDVGSAAATENCREWNQWAIGEVSGGTYDLVVISNRTFQQLVGVSPADRNRVAESAYATTLRAIASTGTRVLVIRDVPSAVDSAPDCVSAHPGDVLACANPRGTAVEADPLHDAAVKDTTGLVSTLDLTDRFCRDDRCHVVIGGLIAYFDHGHLTTTFARTLVPDVRPALERALGAAGG